MSYPQTAISDIANFINGFPFKPSDWCDKGYKIIRIQNLSNLSKPFNRTQKEVPTRYLVKRGDILVSWSATIDVFEWDDEDSYLNQHIFKVEYNPQKVDKQYFKLSLKNTIRELGKFAHGSTMKHVVKGDFDNHQIPLPPLDDQIRIATLLSKVEKLISRRCEQLRQLDELLKSVFLEMFGDPVLNEEGWEKKILGDVSDIQGGLQVSIKRLENPIELPYLRVANVYRDFLDLREIKTIRVTEAESKRASLENGDILVVEGHGNPTEIGRSAVWDGSIENCLHQNHLIRVRPFPEYALSVFVSFYINSSIGRQQMCKAGKTTSGLNTISTKNVKETQILLPPLDLQKSFAAIVTKVESMKTSYAQSLIQLESLYGTISQKAFKGELDLSRVPLVEESEPVS